MSSNQFGFGSDDSCGNAFGGGDGHKVWGRTLIDILLWISIFTTGILFAILVIGFILADKHGEGYQEHGGRLVVAVVIFIIITWLLRIIRCSCYGNNNRKEERCCRRENKCF